MAKDKRRSFVVGTRGEVAAFFGVHVRTVAEWIVDGMPGKPKAYPLDRIVKWHIKHVRPNLVREGSRKPGTTEAEHFAALELAEQEIKIERLRLKLLKESGELVSRVAAFAQIEQMFALLRARWESIPEEICSSVPPDLRADVVADWRDKVDLLNREIESWSLETA